MKMVCPKCSAPRSASDDPAASCPQCGIVYAKYDPEKAKILEAQREQLRELAEARAAKAIAEEKKTVKRKEKKAEKKAKSKAKSEEKKANRPENHLSGMQVLGGLAIGIGVIWFMSQRDRSPSRDRSPNSVASKRSTCDKGYAYVMSNNFIEKQLRAPSTAKFAPMYEAKIVDHGDGSFDIFSYVDAQNAFGAMLRQHYSVSLRCSGDTWNLIEQNIW